MRDCCYVNQDGNACTETAVWCIQAGSEPCTHTDACVEHVGQLLVPDITNVVYEIEAQDHD